MKTFKQYLKESVNDDLFHLRTQWKQMGVEVFLYLRQNDIELCSIKVDKNKQGLGLGSKVMQELIDLAQINNLRITLTPSTELGGSSKTRLETFYKRFGFKHNDGVNKDLSTSGMMIWTPKAINN